MDDKNQGPYDIRRAADAPTQRVRTGGKTSVEAAQDYLDAMEEQQRVFDMEALERSHLRRLMGFDFEVKFAPNKIFVTDASNKKIRTHAKLTADDYHENGELLAEKVTPRLVDACVRLKTLHDNQGAKK